MVVLAFLSTWKLSEVFPGGSETPLRVHITSVGGNAEEVQVRVKIVERLEVGDSRFKTTGEFS